MAAAGVQSDTALVEAKPAPAAERPDIWKSEGNARLTAGDDEGATQSYTRGIEAARQAGVAGKVLGQLHANRAQALMRLSRPAEAMEDCEAAVTADPANAKAYWRGGSAALKINQPATAADFCRRGMAIVGESTSLRSLLDEAEEKIKELSAEDEHARNVDTALATTIADGEKRIAVPSGTNEPTHAAAADGGTIGQTTQQFTAVSGQDLADRGLEMLNRYKDAELNRDEEDARGAKRFFERALVEDPGNETALLGLGDIYDGGLGVSRDPLKGGRFWLQAQEGGSRKAQIKLCVQGLDSWAVMVRAQAMGDSDEPVAPAPPATAGVFKIVRDQR